VADIPPDVKIYLRQQAELFPSELYLLPEPSEPAEDSSAQLPELENQVRTCTACELSRTRQHVVFGMGNPQAELLFIGEAPGANEDLQGLPFVGRAGQLLDKILAAIGLRREQVYIANVLKCRPPENRTPHSNEVAHCEPYLIRQIQLIRPRLIVCLGLTAARTLLRIDYPLEKMRGQIFQYQGVDLLVTYHPAALLRNEQLKKPTWEDFKKIREIYVNQTGG